MGGVANTPSGASITGLTHLEGKTVKVIIDDAMSADATVSSGAIVVSTLPTSYIEIGLNYTPTIKTMPVELKLPSGNTVGQKKRIVEASALLYLSQNLTLDAKEFPFTAASFFKTLIRSMIWANLPSTIFHFDNFPNHLSMDKLSF